MTHKEQPRYYLYEPISDEMQKGLELAAAICRMYGEGEIWASVILCRGEQIRASWWMEYEKRSQDK